MFLPGASETSQETQRVIDAEVRTLVEDAHPRSRSCSKIIAISSRASRSALLKAETLDAPEAYAAAGVPLTLSLSRLPLLSERASARPPYRRQGWPVQRRRSQ